MMIFDDATKPIIIESMYTPLVTRHMWILNLSLMDYCLAPIPILEEITCPALTIRIEGFDIILPTIWYLLVYDQETMQLDTVKIRDLPGRQFTALIGGPYVNKPLGASVIAVDYTQLNRNIGPSLNKHQMLCHPVAEHLWINVSPTDVYNKYLKDKIIGDLL